MIYHITYTKHHITLLIISIISHDICYNIMYTRITLLTNLIRFKHLCCCVTTPELYSSWYLPFNFTCTVISICVVKDKM